MTGDSVQVNFELMLEARVRLEGIVRSFAQIPSPAADQFPLGVGAAAAVAEHFGTYAAWWAASATQVAEELGGAVQAIAAAQAHYQQSEGSIADAAVAQARL